jgi:hypothetical protein
VTRFVVAPLLQVIVNFFAATAGGLIATTCSFGFTAGAA